MVYEYALQYIFVIVIYLVHLKIGLRSKQTQQYAHPIFIAHTFDAYFSTLPINIRFIWRVRDFGFGGDSMHMLRICVC